MRERAEEVTPPARFDFVAPVPADGKKETASRKLFSTLDDNAPHSICVHTHWLIDVRAVTEDGFFAIANQLPAEASEALLEYTATGTLLVAAPMPMSPQLDDLFIHLDVLRPIRPIADQKELEQALGFRGKMW